MRSIRTWAVVAVLVAAAVPLAGGCSQNPVTGRREMILISESQEISMGEEAAPEFEKEFGGRVANDTLQQYVSGVGMRLAAVADRKMPYAYTLVASDVPNAFALPGGKVFITAGLLARMTNERQLAAVLGHETAHVAARHNVKGMQKQMGAALLVEVASRIVDPSRAQTAAAVAKVVGTMATLKYSRDDEYEADAVGARYAARAGYNPWGMVELLTVLKNLSDSEPGRFAEMFQTHPLSSKRIEEAEAVIRADARLQGFNRGEADPAAARFLEMRSLLAKVVPNVKAATVAPPPASLRAAPAPARTAASSPRPAPRVPAPAPPASGSRPAPQPQDPAEPRGRFSGWSVRPAGPVQDR